MQQIKVDVRASFPSGAVIELTNEQVTKVQTYVTEMLFGEKVTKKRKTKKYSHWSQEEVNELKRIKSLPKAEYKKARHQFSSRYGKTATQISSKLWEIKQRKPSDFFFPHPLKVENL